ncbi:hypothetical protein DL96DRAFT_1530418 [Flagelloscypha sp. PMI_526]|nr:hypothetical protein DL96DRAFT_1530418 [Flagelloscypha sp. PMI_526]
MTASIGSTTQALRERFESTSLMLPSTPTSFLDVQREIHADSDLATPNTLDPKLVPGNVKSQKMYMRNLKFQYIEQKAKNQFVRTIISDIEDVPMITQEDNKSLEEVNSAKKEKLRAVKEQLAATRENIETMAPLVEDDYRKVKDSIEEAQTLAQKILDAQLLLSRIRQSHPQPRYTIESAEAKLDEQVAEMQTLTDSLEESKKRFATTKKLVARANENVERLRGERAEMERQFKEDAARSGDPEDARLPPLYDWFTASISVHCWIHNLHESVAVSDNELRLTYALPGDQKVVIHIVYIPGTKQLASVEAEGVEELGLDVQYMLDGYVRANDVQGAVSAVLSAARGAVRSQ